jgi:hypothetical protein
MWELIIVYKSGASPNIGNYHFGVTKLFSIFDLRKIAEL